VSRTRLDALGAAAALLEPLRVGLERERRDDLAEEQPRSDLGVDETRVLADPSKPAYCAYTRSCTGPVSTYARASNGAPAPSRIQSSSPSIRVLITS
jgi:hypothetical protein